MLLYRPITNKLNACTFRIARFFRLILSDWPLQLEAIPNYCAINLPMVNRIQMFKRACKNKKNLFVRSDESIKPLDQIITLLFLYRVTYCLQPMHHITGRYRARGARFKREGAGGGGVNLFYPPPPLYGIGEGKFKYNCHSN